MVELDGVANVDSLGGGIYNFLEAGVVEGRYNAESVSFVEVPGLAWSGFGVDGDFSSNWA